MGAVGMLCGLSIHVGVVTCCVRVCVCVFVSICVSVCVHGCMTVWL